MARFRTRNLPGAEYPPAAPFMSPASDMEKELSFRHAEFLGEIPLKRPDLAPALALKKWVRRGDFRNPETRARHRRKLARVHAAVALDRPDRVPVITGGLNFFPAVHGGITMARYCHDRTACERAFLGLVRDEPGFDAVFPAGLCHQGPLMGISGLDILALPGVDLPEDVPYQFVEKERLSVEGLDDFLADGWGTFRKKVLPAMTPHYDPEKGWGTSRAARLAAESLSYAAFYIRLIDRAEKEFGVPVDAGTLFFAPFDLASILFRGLSGISADLFRRPEKVEAMTGLLAGACLKCFENAVVATGLNTAIVLCERAFSLSPKQFARFYFPDLKKLCGNLLNRGVLPVIALEGNAAHLLPFFRELPRGRALLALDTTDLGVAKKELGDHLCLAGGVPMTLLALRTPEKVRNHVRGLLREYGPENGFILSGALGIPDNARPENVSAMVDAALEFGGR